MPGAWAFGARRAAMRRARGPAHPAHPALRATRRARPGRAERSRSGPNLFMHPPASPRVARARRPASRRKPFGEGWDYLRKWGLLGVLIGACAAAGALSIIALIQVVQHAVFLPATGGLPALPGGEAGGAAGAPPVTALPRPWVLPLLGLGGGLAGGVLVRRFARDAGGIGTNAAIAAFHANRRVPVRTTVVKVLTSAITIGTGMTSGREGPVAQVGAGAGSAIAHLLGLTARERNIALAAGLGAGISAMFRAPLAGAILGAEVFYREDFEVEAMVPGLVASVTSYAIVGAASGFQPIFALGPLGSPFDSPLSLALYAALGVACAAGARYLIAVFFPVERAFRRLPFVAATALGGLGAGTVGMLFPGAIGTGYGYMQAALVQPGPPLLLALGAFAVLTGAALTLGSGNSGGVFGPTVVAGGLLGAAFGGLAHAWLPGLASHPAAFAVVGMVALFAGAAKAPVSTIVMIAEMTGGYALLGPSMVAVVTAFLLSGKGTIFPAQVRARPDSPFHADEFEPIVLRRTKVGQVMQPVGLCVDADWPLDAVLDAMTKRGARSVLVLRQGALEGIITARDVLRVREDRRGERTAGEVMTRDLAVAHPNEDLYTVLERLIVRDVGQLPVVDREERGRVLGVVSRGDIGQAIQEARAGRAGPGRPAGQAA